MSTRHPTHPERKLVDGWGPDPREAYAQAFPKFEDAPPNGSSDRVDVDGTSVQYKLRLLCDPREHFLCAYTNGAFKYDQGPAGSWQFTVQEGRVTGYFNGEKFRSCHMTRMLDAFKKLLPSLEGYVTSSLFDYWVVGDKVYVHRHMSTIQEQARLSYTLNRDADQIRKRAADQEEAAAAQEEAAAAQASIQANRAEAAAKKRQRLANAAGAGACRTVRFEDVDDDEDE